MAILLALGASRDATFFREASANIRDQQVEVGRRLANLMTPNDTVLVGDAGAIPYFPAAMLSTLLGSVASTACRSCARRASGRLRPSNSSSVSTSPSDRRSLPVSELVRPHHVVWPRDRLRDAHQERHLRRREQGHLSG